MMKKLTGGYEIGAGQIWSAMKKDETGKGYAKEAVPLRVNGWNRRFLLKGGMPPKPISRTALLAQMGRLKIEEKQKEAE